MSKSLIGIGVLVILAAVGLWMVSDLPSTPPSPTASLEAIVPNSASADIPPADNTNSAGVTAVAQEEVREFTILASNFSFAPSSITVKKGDRVKIIFKNTGGLHDFKIDEFGVATKKISGGAEETITFVADKVGTFEYYCSIGQHRAMGMKGALTVE